MFDEQSFEELEAAYKANARQYRVLHDLCDAQRGEISRRVTLRDAEAKVAAAQAELAAAKTAAKGAE